MRYRGHFFAIYVFLPLVAAALWGCGKLAVQHPGEGHAGPVGSLEIVVENFVGEEPRRTIAPDQLTVQQLAGTGYTLKLSGTTGRMSLPERALTLTNGRASLGDIPVGLWELTLTAYDGNSVAVLQGKATHQVRQVGGGEVSFLLTPAGVTGTGTLNLTLNWNQSDFDLMASDTSKDRAWRMALYYPGTEVQLSGSQAEWNRLATSANQSFTTTLTYTGGSVTQIPAGEYEFRFWMWGGGLPAGTTLVWKDNLYVEPGRQTAATITVPQLAYKPAAPTGVQRDIDVETGGKFFGDAYWTSVYNADRYEMEIKSFTSGNWNNYNESTWNTLTGGATYKYTTTAWSPNGAPVYKVGSLDKSIDPHFGVEVTRNNRFWVVRVRAVNRYGTSAWTHFPHLFMPNPEITSATPVNIGNSASNVADKNRRFDMNFTFRTTSYGTAYEFHWMRLDTGTLAEAITDEGWARLRAVNTAGSGQNTLTNIAANTHRLDGFLLGKMWVFRMRTVSNNGNSPWFYYNQIVQQN